MFVEFFVLFLSLTMLWFVIQMRKRKNRPPGPFPLPILGNLLDIVKADPKAHIAFMKLARKYGGVMTIYKGTTESVVVSSYEAMKEHMTTYEFSGREFPVFLKRPTNNRRMGIIFVHGEAYTESRRFAIHYLRDYGFGKRNSMEDVIEEELRDLTDRIKNVIKEDNGKMHFSAKFFSPPVLNLLWSSFAGNRFDHSNPRIIKLIDAVFNFFKSLESLVFTPMMAFPILEPLYQNNKLNTAHKEMQDIIELELQETVKKNPDYMNNPQCFLDIVLREMEKNKDSKNLLYDRDNMKTIIFDLILGGAETSSNVIWFSVLYFLVNQEAQKKAQKEIDENIPLGAQIKLSDRSKLPYMHACVTEILRQSTVVPFPVTREALKDSHINGYFVPKGTPVLINQYAANYDEDFWKDPNVFRPERFLDSNGQMIKALEDRVVTFGFGKRFCPGESLATASTFAFISTLIQRFSFLPVPGEEIPTCEPDLGITLSPRPFNAIVIFRDV